MQITIALLYLIHLDNLCDNPDLRPIISHSERNLAK